MTRLAWSLGALTPIVLVLGLILWTVAAISVPAAIGVPSLPLLVYLQLNFTITFLIVSGLGVLVAIRHPRNPIGWLFIAGGFLASVELAHYDYTASALLAGLALPFVAAVAWTGTLFHANPLILAPALLFSPDGRLISKRWRLAVWLTIATAVVLGIGHAFSPGPLSTTGPLGNYLPIDNPLGIQAAASWLQVLIQVGNAMFAASILLAAASLVLRFRWAVGDERQQLKWIAYATVVLAPALLVAIALPREWLLYVSLAYPPAFDLWILALGVAVLRYRLYAIDLVISRTLVYSALAVLIAVVYVAIVVGVGTLAGTQGEPNLVLSLVATTLVAFSFQPLRERLQRLANRLVYGQRASPYEVLSQFSRRIAGALSIDDVPLRMAEAAARAVGGIGGRVRVYLPGGVNTAVAWPESAVVETYGTTVPVLHQGRIIGEIAVAKRRDEPLTQPEAGLLADLAAQAGPALSNVRLNLELRASRQRIVAAQDAERRRLERDIHDGAQQELVALSINVQVARELLRSDPALASAFLADVSTQASAALETLQELARGIFPSVLADRGLVPALESHLTRLSVGAALQADVDGATRRFDPELEAAVYFCCLEALQNCAKHAPSSRVSMRLAASDGSLMFEVTDSGPGFDPSRPGDGTGLQGMADRLSALGGRCEVQSVIGVGTTVRGWVPLRLSVIPAQAEPPPELAAAQATRSAAGPN